MNLLQILELEPKVIGNCQRSNYMFSTVRFKGSSGSVQTFSTLNKDQRKVGKAVGETITERLRDGIPAFEGQLTADIPDVVGDAFDSFTSQDRSLSEAERNALSNLSTGQSFYDSDPEQVIQDWRENFANPLTTYYNEFIRPEVREEFNVPGGFNTSERAEGVSRAFNEFYGGQVAPTLFQAQENERQREFAARSQAANLQLPALQFSQNLPSLELGQAFQGAAGFQSFEQQGLSARYNEFLRQALAEQNFATIGANFATKGTTDTVITPGQKSNLGSAIGAGAGFLVAGPAGVGTGAAIGSAF